MYYYSIDAFFTNIPLIMGPNVVKLKNKKNENNFYFIF